MNAINQIEKNLAGLFQEQDKLIADRDVEWAFRKYDALVEYKKTDEYATIAKKGAWGGMYDKLFSIAGGKTWYRIFSSNNRQSLEIVIREMAEMIAKKRTQKIASKLLKAGVSEVVSADVSYCPDGFRGVFWINGSRCVTIKSILAGGPVQRLHQRVLCNVSKEHS